METANSTAIADYLLQAANIPSPWRSTKYHIDGAAKIIHIWITRHPAPQVIKKRNWFGKIISQPVASAPPAGGPDLHWRHLNFMDYTCMVHTTDVLDPRHHDLPWFGQTGLPFSNRLARQVFMCLMEGMEVSSTCALLNIAYADLWRFKFAIDNGLVKFDDIPAKDQHRFATHNGTATAHASGAATPEKYQVPDVSDPVWAQLMTSELNIQIKTLGFQLLLSKLRQQVSMQQNEDVKIMKLRELHRYVERNARSLEPELQQLRAHAHLELA
jgi:hypothetical protein